MNNVRKPGERYGLNIGCGKEYRESEPQTDSVIKTKWTNLDGDPAVRADVRFRLDRIHERYAGFFDEIIAKDVLEHVPCNNDSPDAWLAALQSWCWCLAPGGTLWVQVPDIEAILKQFHDGTIDEATMNRVIFGTNTGVYDRHYRMFLLRELRKTMIDFGLNILEAYNLHVCAIVIGEKR